MKKALIIVHTLLITYGIFGQNEYHIIPYPNKLTPKDGFFEFKHRLTITIPSVFGSVLDVFDPVFQEEYFTKLIPAANGRIVFEFNKSIDREGYKLSVKQDSILVEASGSAGCFYAIQSIRQLMKLTGKGSYAIAACEIEDVPVFQWRSFMLDESRHFMGKQFVKTIIDQMALLKMNVFHWHLTDDHGWRIEIKKYPLLTDVGAWREHDRVSTALYREPNILDSVAHGGFYTQEDIKEIVAYSAKRYIEIVPEIEMPSHCCGTTTVAAIKEAKNTPEIPAYRSWGAAKAYPWLGEGLFNLGDDRVIPFLKDVLAEIISIFPGKIIHVGGDEPIFDYWKKNKEVNVFMRKKGISSYPDLHVYLMNTMAEFLESKGKRLMGWNDILGKNLHGWESYPDATIELVKGPIIQFWKGDQALLKEMMEKGYDVVNSDHRFTYLDYSHDHLSLKKVYNFSPEIKGLSPSQRKRLLGISAPLWTERYSRKTDLYIQIFPRIAALAEVAWTNEERKNFDRFKFSLEMIKREWNYAGIPYFEEASTNK